MILQRVSAIVGFYMQRGCDSSLSPSVVKLELEGAPLCDGKISEYSVKNKRRRVGRPADSCHQRT